MRFAHRVSLLICIGSLWLAAVARADDFSVVEPPEDLRQQLNLSPFYKKCLAPGGFAIVSSDKVSDFALYEAAYVVNSMLAGRDDVRQALIKNRVRLAVMAPTELTCDIPEHSDLTPPAYWNRRARGLGATRVRPAVSCAEENVLGLVGDPYSTESILVHEFSHAIHIMGLNTVDPTFDQRLKEIYAQAMQEELWKGKYAATNHSEYWAEAVQSWFGTNRENDHDHNHVNTRDELKEYDPRLAKLVDETFPNNNWQYIRPDKRPEVPAHLKGFDRAAAPKFQWPAEVIKAFEEHQAKKKKQETPSTKSETNPKD
ncbi:MAG: hypothetical protein AABP62_05915 [Planctomycetota bacterium]